MTREKLIRKPIPVRIQEARVVRGLNLSELASKLDITRQAMSKYEKGEIVPTLENLNKISEILNFPVSYFFKEFEEDPMDCTLYYRATKQKKAIAVTKKAYEMHLKIAKRPMKLLDQYINLPKLNLPDVPDKLWEDITDEDIEQLANEVREFWGLKLNPISNMIRLFEQNGIFVFKTYAMTNKIDALSSIDDEKAYILMSKDKHSCVRKRFDLGHELGHFMMHRDLTQEEYDDGMEKIEKQADRFASAFLMPQETFSNEVISLSLDFLVKLKFRWKTSIGAIMHRMHDLGITTDNQNKTLNIEMSTRKWRKNEPLDDQIPNEESKLFSKSFEMLEENEILTMHEILTKYCLSQDEFEQYYDVKFKDEKIIDTNFTLKVL